MPLSLLLSVAGGFLLIVIFYLFFKFLLMTEAPFKTMKAFYVYIAALVGLGIIAFGLYGLIGVFLSILLTEENFSTYLLVRPLTQIIVGLFVMLPHWAIGHHFNLMEHKKKL